MPVDQAETVLVQVGQSSNSPTEIESVLQERNYNTRTVQCKDFSDVAEEVENVISSVNRVVIIFNQPPRVFPSRLLQLAMDRSAVKRSRMLHLVKNFDGSDCTLVEHRRVEKMFHYIDWMAEQNPIDIFRRNLDSESNHDFSSFGEGLAWPIVINFLSDVVTQLQEKIKHDIGLITPERLHEWGIDGVDPSELLVVEKFFMIFNVNLVLQKPAESQDPRCPEQLFPGCMKISSSDGLKSPAKPLTFESHVYEKKIHYYLVKLNDQQNNRFTHALIFCCYAAPTFVIQKLQNKTLKQKLQIFRDFKNEVNYILHHPKASELLRKFAVSVPGAAQQTGDESTRLRLIDIPIGCTQLHEESVLKDRIYSELEEYFASLEVANQLESLPLNRPPIQADASNSLLLRHSPELVWAASRLGEVTNAVVTDRLSQHNFQDVHKIILVLHKKDLGRNLNMELRTDIRLAVDWMHRCGKYNVILVIAAPKGANRPASFDLLPECLKHLPRSCVEYADDENLVADVKSINPLVTGPNVEDTLPLMSMAESMTANLTLGLADRIKRHVQLKHGEGGEIEFSLPYCFVFPRSNRCPNQRELHERLQELGATRTELKFTDDGQEISLTAYKWESLNIAFEFPPSLRCIRGQAECDNGGIRERQIRTNINEFQEKLMLEYFDEEHRRTFNTSDAIDWDDLTGLPAGAWSDPGLDYARSLMECLAARVRNYSSE